MKALNLGSLNIDRVYDVESFVQPGETILAKGYATFCGGKGMNQSLAAARAGCEVWHAGAVGADGEPLLELLRREGVELGLLQKTDSVSGHAIIQVTSAGQNSIIVCQGANGEITKDYINQVLKQFTPGDFLLLQNEISCVGYAMRRGKEQGLTVVLNPSPITPELLTYPLELADFLVLNEVEGRALCGEPDCPDEELPERLHTLYPGAVIVLTLGKQGVYYYDGKEKLHHGVYDVPVVDTTAAGDTFCGYFVAAAARGLDAAEAIRAASLASSLAVSRKGASDSIPTRLEVERFGACNADKTF